MFLDQTVDEFVKSKAAWQKLVSMDRPGRVAKLYLSRSPLKRVAVSQLSSLLCVEKSCTPEAVQALVKQRIQVALMST